jgi:PAS domain S-box-containing protein
MPAQEECRNVRKAQNVNFGALNMSSRFTEEQLIKIRSMLFTSAAEGLVVVDGSGSICLNNPRLDELFGYGPSELLDSPIEVLIPMPLRRKHVQQRQDYHDHPAQRPMGIGMDLMGQRKDGSTFPVEVSLNHFEVDGERYVMGLVTDITQRRLAEEELNRAHTELEARVELRTTELRNAEQNVRKALEVEKELNALKSRFVSMASHEFRTPLTTIMSSVDLITRYAEGPQQEKIEKHLIRIRGKVRELTSMLNDFLSLEKLEQGLVTINPTEVDIVHLSIELIEELRAIAKRGQEIQFDHSGSDRMVNQDRGMLTNIISNLVSNAIKYSPENKPIRMLTDLEHGRLRITVEDHGIGIPLEDQAHLFQRFFRASNAFTVQGTGLGLSIVNRYLDLLGGTISFTSVPEQGTTFNVEIPQYHVKTNYPVDRG